MNMQNRRDLQIITKDLLKPLAIKLLSTLAEEISLEFPYVNKMPKLLLDRHYELISDKYWGVQ